ncbi:uncharacterized protein LOC135620379 [Musa acuminata AAA Group]|uniref:uncharacterized protein LOC135620379 n=1 Tax=Musa acuminata AAA Group TaxID=214697 RepID=UPI0031D5F392
MPYSPTAAAAATLLVAAYAAGRGRCPRLQAARQLAVPPLRVGAPAGGFAGGAALAGGAAPAGAAASAGGSARGATPAGGAVPPGGCPWGGGGFALGSNGGRRHYPEAPHPVGEAAAGASARGLPAPPDVDQHQALHYLLAHLPNHHDILEE